MSVHRVPTPPLITRAAGLAVVAALALAAPALAAAGDDPLLASQPALTDPALLGAEEAWTQATGRGAVVALLDTGVQLDHPDLRGALWHNPRETPGNGVDDDANGYVDDVHGANVLDGTGRVADDAGHGTHVAGVIAAAANNGTGGSGVAPDARLMVVKVLDRAGGGGAAALAAGIRYAVARGARILSTPLNSDTPSPVVEQAIAEAAAAGATVVASAGNAGRDIDATPSYPASLRADNVLAAGALAGSGALWPGSNRGAGSVDVLAPGQDIVSTALGGGYEERSGTSMASAYVAGTLALLASARPDAGQAELRRVLVASARPARGASAAGGITAGGAMHRLLPGTAWREPVRLRTPARVRAGLITLRWSSAAVAGISRWRVTVDGRTVGRLVRGAPLAVRARLAPGRHRWRVVGLGAGARRLAGRAGLVQAVRR